jgi:glycosyltransferase involved in cell wall biosynthesis
MTSASATTIEPKALHVASAAESSAKRGGASRMFWRCALRGIMVLYDVLMVVLCWIGPRGRPNRIKREVLLTGTFYSDNWILAHVKPMALSRRCHLVRLVSTYPVPRMAGVQAVYPPAWLVRMIGGVPARLATFSWYALWTRPDYIGGFHLLVNGLVAGFLSRMVGAKSIYFCVGGPREVLDGGIHAENRLFSRLETPDPWMQQRLTAAVGRFDLVVTMGSGAKHHYRSIGMTNEFEVVSGGIDSKKFELPAVEKEYDFILVGRLAPIKRIDIYLRAIQLVASKSPKLRAAIVGDGELRVDLQRLASQLKLSDQVHLAGHQQDVADWLNRSRVFCLTSDSEGLALSVMEAMMAGVPCVVSDVGDLGDVVVDGENGFLVDSRDPADFASAMSKLIEDHDRWKSFSRAAKRAGLSHDVASVTRQWDGIFAAKAAS